MALCGARPSSAFAGSAMRIGRHRHRGPGELHARCILHPGLWGGTPLTAACWRRIVGSRDFCVLHSSLMIRALLSLSRSVGCLGQRHGVVVVYADLARSGLCCVSVCHADARSELLATLGRYMRTLTQGQNFLPPSDDTCGRSEVKILGERVYLLVDGTCGRTDAHLEKKIVPSPGLAFSRGR